MARKPKAPTVEEQLKREGAKGSALEKPTRANQDFELLHPDEFDDEYLIPLWLRVAWRKQNPDVELPAENPGGVSRGPLPGHRRMVASPNDAWGSDAAAPGRWLSVGRPADLGRVAQR